jgi:hypothetical protein
MPHWHGCGCFAAGCCCHSVVDRCNRFCYVSLADRPDLCVLHDAKFTGRACIRQRSHFDMLPKEYKISACIFVVYSACRSIEPRVTRKRPDSPSTGCGTMR